MNREKDIDGVARFQGHAPAGKWHESNCEPVLPLSCVERLVIVSRGLR